MTVHKNQLIGGRVLKGLDCTSYVFQLVSLLQSALHNYFTQGHPGIDSSCHLFSPLLPRVSMFLSFVAHCCQEEITV